MKYGKEIRENIQCIRYYAGRVEELAKKQLDIDMENKSVHPESATLRFDSLGTLSSANSMIGFQCSILEGNLKSAEGEDGKFVDHSVRVSNGN